MRALVLLCLTALPAASQTASAPAPGLPKQPLAIFEAAAPHYDFNDANLKPFHLKATYQLYDESGQPGEKGTYEYWWVSPTVSRSTWTRPGGTHSDWHTADGKHAYQGTGERLQYFENKLQNALLSPLPPESDRDPAKFRLDRKEVDLGKVKLPCIEVVPSMPLHGQVQVIPLGEFPTYCFDPEMPVLRASYSWGSVTTGFDKIAMVQNRYLARGIEMLEGKRKILTAEVETVTGLSASDPALTPPAEALASGIKGAVNMSAGVAQGLLAKKDVPVYPADAKEARVDGIVVLDALIGMDGGIHDLHVVSAPSPSLAASALWSVSHWEYKPYLLNGAPVEVKTTINVIFKLGP